MAVDNTTILSVLDKYGDMLYFLAFHYVRTESDAEDIIQEVFLSYFKHGELSGEAEKAWLIRVTVNKCLDFVKKTKRAAMDRVAYDEETLAAEQPDYAMLYDAMQKLVPLDREIVFLHYYAGYSSKEIGKILHKTDSAVRKRLERAKTQLKDFLED